MSIEHRDVSLDPTVLTVTPGMRDRAGVKEASPGAGPDVELRRWPEGKVFAEAKTAVWTETREEVGAGAHGKVFAEAGIMTETQAWAEGWRPADTDDTLPSVPEDPAPMLVQEKLRMGGEVQREQAALSSVLSMLTESAELHTAAVRKPLGLLSKAAWSRSSSSSSKALSLSTMKASTLPSTPSSPPSKKLSQTTASTNISVAFGNNGSSANYSLGGYSTFRRLPKVLIPLIRHSQTHSSVYRSGSL